jgi:capsular exopolysaccharide synthesis family protein
MPLQEEEIHLKKYWKILSKRRYVAVFVFILFILASLVYSFTAVPIYKGTSQILFEHEKNPTMDFIEGEGGYMQLKDFRDYYETQVSIIKNRAFADRVVRRLELNKNLYFIKQKDSLATGYLSTAIVTVKGLLGRDAVAADHESNESALDYFPNYTLQNELDPVLTDIVLDGIHLDMAAQGSILKLSFSSVNPKVSAVMANGIASTYIEHNIDIRVRPFKDAVEWLSSRIVDLRSKVETSERSLQQYKETKGIVSFESKENVLTQELQELVSQLVRLEAKRQDAEIRYKQIKNVINSPERLATVPDIMNNLVIQGIRTEEMSLKKKKSQLSDKYGEKHPQMIKVSSELAMVQENLITETRKMLSAAKTEYEIAKSAEYSLKKRLNKQKQSVLELSREAIEFNVVAGESGSNKQFYEILLKKMQEASLSSGINVSNAQVIDRAVIPDKPITPKKLYNLALASMMGLFFGICAAFYLEYMDDTLKTSEDVNEVLGLPFLGYIPTRPLVGKNPAKGILMLVEPKSVVAEAYRTLRTSLIFSSAENQMKVILLTSSAPSEGKTTTATNLAVAMSQTGEEVLLIDADLRHNSVHKHFKLKNKAGLTNLLIGESNNLTGVVQKVPGLEKLSILTGGAMSPNPSELLGSDRMKELITFLSTKYDRIIIDSPPVMAVSDPLILSAVAEGIVMVVWGEHTGQDMVKKSIEAFRGINAKITGVVLNNLSLDKVSEYYYPYYNTYVNDENKNT